MTDGQQECFYLFVDANEDGERIDKYLSEEFDNYSRSFLQKLIKDSCVLVNNEPVKSSYRVSHDDKLKVVVPAPEKTEIVPENIPLDILYEDDDIIVINKPKDMVVHPAAGHYSHTLVNALMYHCNGKLSGINGVLRPGIVHRIDKDTTGVLVACKNDFAHQAVASQLAVHSITRKYQCICHNRFSQNEGTIDAPIGRHPADRKKMAVNYRNGRKAVTHYHVLENFRDMAYAECSLETGRTHQIRVHMASVGHPLLGDSVYSQTKSPWKLCGQTLHARILGFVHPRTGEYMEFEAPLPDYFEKILGILHSR